MSKAIDDLADERDRMADLARCLSKKLREAKHGPLSRPWLNVLFYAMRYATARQTSAIEDVYQVVVSNIHRIPVQELQKMASEMEGESRSIDRSTHSSISPHSSGFLARAALDLEVKAADLRRRISALPATLSGAGGRVGKTKKKGNQ